MADVARGLGVHIYPICAFDKSMVEPLRSCSWFIKVVPGSTLDFQDQQKNGLPGFVM